MPIIKSMQKGYLLSVLLMLAAQLWFTQAAQGQNIAADKVTLTLRGESLESAIKKIERQSVFRFFYHVDDIKSLAHLNLPSGTRTVKQTLDALLQNTQISYRQIDANILLERKPRQAFFDIKGRVLNLYDKKPIADASVFLSATTAGDHTKADGTFVLHQLKPGKYQLAVSMLGFEAYDQTVQIDSADANLADIIILPQAINLTEVTVKPVNDPNRERNYDLFRDEFLGTSELAKHCKVLNPQELELESDDITGTLTASSNGYLEIENADLGYKLKYLVTNFSVQYITKERKKIYYQGSVLFEELKGSPSDLKRWKKRREQVYENSPMHFLRSALNNTLDEDGFRVQQMAVYANPERPSDSLINAKIKYYTQLNPVTDAGRDSLSFWAKKSRLKRTLQQLLPFALNKQDIITPTDQPGQYALGCEGDGLYVSYSKSHRFHISDQLQYLYNPANYENTLISFTDPNAFFNSSGVVFNPYSTIYYGVWGKHRVAELLPADYEPEAVISPHAEDKTIPITNYSVPGVSSDRTSQAAQKAYQQATYKTPL